MSNKENKSKDKSAQSSNKKSGFLGLPIILFVVGAILLALLGVGAFLIIRGGFFAKLTKQETPETQIEKYFETEAKKGEFHYERLTGDSEEEGRFWVKERRFKIEFDQEDGYKRWIISPDGELAYFCYEEDEVCKPSVAPVDNYMLRWNQPSADTENIGNDEEYSCEQIKYEVDKTFDMKGSSNPYYVKDVLYCVNDEGIVYRNHSGNVVREDGSYGEERISRFYIKETEYDIEVDNDFFALPYDVEEE
jgi:hypothetical protein